MRAVAACGTRSGHVRHWRKSETPCAACVAAEREYQRLRWQRRRNTPQTPAAPVAGSTSPAQPDTGSRTAA